MAILDGLESSISGILEQSHFQALDQVLFKSWYVKSKDSEKQVHSGLCLPSISPWITAGVLGTHLSS